MGTHQHRWGPQVILKSALPAPPDGPKFLGSLRGHMLFECACGEQFFLRETNSFKGWDKVQCRNCQRQSRMLDKVGERYVMKRVKSDATRAGREFNLTLEQVEWLIHQPCHYCGAKNKNTINVRSKSKGKYLIRGYKYNGIDRVDNNIGYTPKNVVPCCHVCNRAKNSMPYEDFIDWIDNMIEWRRN
jgi:hypothetical protein